MKHYTELTSEKLLSLDLPTINTNKKVTYYNVETSFDIETTSTEIHGEKFAFMYIAMFGIGYEGDVYFARTWDEVVDMFELIVKTLNVNLHNRFVVYVHNLSYEFQFMRRYFDWESVFAVDERKPLKALTTSGIEFRCSYMLSGYSLENTAKNLATYKVEKMVGDLDYSLIRTCDTPLTEKEMGYCKNDIVVVNAYIKEQLEQYQDIAKIPMTNTGRVRSYVRNNCYYTSTNHRKSSKGKYYRYRKIMQDLTLDSRTYKQLKRAFMGGFTHANADYVGKTLQNVTSIDFTSSYPSVMLAEKYPMSRGKLLVQGVDYSTIEDFNELCQKYGIVAEFHFTNIRSKIRQENYLSESKCRDLKNPIINNGRIHEAEQLTVTLTNVDYDIMLQCYEWDTISVKDVTRFHMNYLPKSILESVVSLYKDKTVLKDVEGYEVEYMLSKGMLNSVYGMSVTDIVKDDHIYDRGWKLSPVNVDDEIESYNESKNRFLYYAWGVFITAYARKNLWTGIIAMGNDYVYSDTDSIKFLNYEKHKGYIDWYDQDLTRKLREMCKARLIKFDELNPKTKDGVPKPIGVWDYEGTYDLFKTLGAKRYMIYENQRIEITVAGLSKQNGVDFMIEQAKGNVLEVFRLFNDQLYIPPHRTGKNTHTYIDHSMSAYITDYLGNETYVQSSTGIHLQACDFTLSISNQYTDFIRNFKEGYFYGGIKHE